MTGVNDTQVWDHSDEPENIPVDHEYGDKVRAMYKRFVAANGNVTRFWWLRDRRHNTTTVASERNGQWVVLGGAAGWWTRDQVAEDYEVLGAVATEPVKE